MCEHHALSVNKVLQQDPTRTKTLRVRFEKEFTKRWNRVLAQLKDYLSQAPDLMTNKDYDFPVGPLQTDTLLDFLGEAVLTEVIDPVEAARVLRAKGAQPTPGNWVEGYLHDSYKKGVRRAQAEINKRVTKGNSVNLMQGALKRKNHQAKLEQILGRVYTDLEGINEAMEAGIRREIALGLEGGEGTATIARRIENRVEKIGKTRARTLARTEVIRSHHAANIATYREAGVKGVKVRAEFSTAGDNRVCTECEGLEGKVYTLDEIEGLIPVHPNCRCVAIPIVDL